MSKKDVIQWGIIVVLILFGIGATTAYLQITDERDSYRSIAYTETQSASFWRNKNGHSQAEAKAAVANREILREIYGDSLKSLRSENKGLKRNLSNLHSVAGISIVTEGEVTVPVTETTVTKPDSSKELQRSASYQDQWGKIEVTFGEDSADFKYSFRDSLTVLWMYKRVKFFKPRELYATVTTYNPHSTVTGLTAIAPRPPSKSRFVLGPFIGIDFRGRPSAGLAVTYSLWQF